MVSAIFTSVHEEHPRSDHSKRLSNLRDEAAHIRVQFQKGEISAEEATLRLEKLTKRHRTFLNRFLDL